VLGIILFISAIYFYPFDNYSYSSLVTTYNSSEINRSFVTLQDNETGHLKGWNPDGKISQFAITDQNIKNDSVLTSVVNTVPFSGLKLGLGSDVSLAEASKGELFIIPYGWSQSSISILDELSNTLSPINMTVDSDYRPTVTKLDSLNVLLCCENSNILVINLPTLTITDKIYIGHNDFNQLYGPYSNMFYFTDWTTSGIKELNITSNTISETIFTGYRPIEVGYEYPHTLYVLNSYYESGTNGTITVINDTAYWDKNQIMIGNTPSDMIVDNSNHRIYVANEGSPYAFKPNGTVSIVDTEAEKVIDTVKVGIGPIRIIQSISPDGHTNLVYVLNQEGTISVINGTSNEVITTIKLSQHTPYYMELNQDTNTLYAVDDDGISVVNATSFNMIKTIPLKFVKELLISDMNKIYATYTNIDDNHWMNFVSIIDGLTNSLVPTNLVTCGLSSIVDSEYFWLKCSGPPSENAKLNYAIEGQ